MTSEYEPGTEDIYISIAARDDGMVGLSIHRAVTHERLYGIVVPPETARNAAQNLTLASWKAEGQT